MPASRSAAASTEMLCRCSGRRYGAFLQWGVKAGGICSGAAGGAFCLPPTGWDAPLGPEVGRGVPTPPSLPLDSTLPATGHGLLALDKPNAVGSTGKN